MLMEIPFLNTGKRTVAFLKGIQDEIGNLVVTMHPGSRKKRESEDLFSPNQSLAAYRPVGIEHVFQNDFNFLRLMKC